METVPASPQHYVWVNKGRFEGHLPLDMSPDAAFSADSSTLAVVNGETVVLMSTAQWSIEKALGPELPGLTQLTIQSVNFVAPDVLFVMGKGSLRAKHGETPLLGFRWSTQQNSLDGKVDTIGAEGGVGPIRYLPQIGFVGIFQESSFQLWNPSTGQNLETRIPDLTRRPGIFTFSPDGHWLIVAQVAGGGTNDPIVIQLSTHQFVNSLRGHEGSVMSVEFSRDSKKVVTACDDGKVRIYTVPDWNLVQTLSGHQGSVHWAEFSPDGKWVVSAGEDQSVRVWSATDGKLVQALTESQEPLRTVAFSPDGQDIAATSQNAVYVWQRTATGN